MQLTIGNKTIKPIIYFCLLLFATSIYFGFNKNKHGAEGVIYSDAEGYYMYLPAVFIYHGFKDIPIAYTKQFIPDSATGIIYTKYTCGVAILQLPFFLTTHLFASFINPDLATGYSYPYRAAIIVAGSFYMILGLYFVCLFLLKSYNIETVIVTAFFLFVGTNLYYYTLDEPGMSHVYSFFLMALFIFLTPKIIYEFSIKRLFWFSFILGIIALVRPSNIIIGLFPLLYSLNHVSEIKNRLTLFLGSLKKILIAALAFAIPFIPQFIYWDYTSGSIVNYSYGDEGFTSWMTPHFLDVWFSVWNGLFIYTPLALVIIVSLIVMIYKKHTNAWLVLLIFILASYIFGSWHMWWFGGSFGHRCFVEYYALLAIPFAYFINVTVFNNKIWVRFLSIIFLLSLSYYNIMLSYIYIAPWYGEEWGWKEYFIQVMRIF
ncbi:MAG: hypothetical protein IPN31_00365 [Bacteroidetes bacterium]|nr:hypothetical protein [Bacteroidota bacterium]